HGYRRWRSVHWRAYASWPVALVHSFGTGSDARVGWLAFVGFTSLALVAASVLARIGLSTVSSTPRVVAAAATLVVSLVIFVWYRGGPQQKGWAARAGTPVALLRRASVPSSGATVSSKTSLPSGSFASRLAGQLA